MSTWKGTYQRVDWAVEGKRGLCCFAVCVVSLFWGAAAADYVFGIPSSLGPIVNSPGLDAIPFISNDGLELYFTSDRPGGYGWWDIWVAKRTAPDAPWQAPTNLGATINTAYNDAAPLLSADGLTLIYSSCRPGGYGNWDLWVSRRADKSSPWQTPSNLGAPVNSIKDEYVASLSRDGLELFFCEQNAFRAEGVGGGDIYVASRASVDDAWGEPNNLGTTVNSAYFDSSMAISADRLTLFFTSTRPGGFGGADLYVTTRASIHDPWTLPVNLGPRVNSSAHDGAPSLSADESMLYFTRSSGLDWSALDLWQIPVSRLPFCGDPDHPYPVGDLNEDCVVNMLDLAILCEHWLEDNNP